MNDTKKRLIEAMRELAEDKEYERIKVRDICKLAGVSTGSFYFAFGSKEALYVAACSTASNVVDLDADIDQKLKDPSNAISEFMISIAEDFSKNGWKHTDIVMKTHASLPKINKQEIDSEFYFLRKKQLLKFIKKAQEKGTFSISSSAEDMADFLIRYSHGIVYDWICTEGAFDLVKTVTKEIDYALALLLK